MGKAYVTGVTLVSGEDSNCWRLESSGSFLTHNFDICTGITQKPVSAETVDHNFRRLCYGASASLQYSGLRVVKVLTWFRWKLHSPL